MNETTIDVRSIRTPESQSVLQDADLISLQDVVGVKEQILWMNRERVLAIIEKYGIDDKAAVSMMVKHGKYVTIVGEFWENEDELAKAMVAIQVAKGCEFHFD